MRGSKLQVWLDFLARSVNHRSRNITLGVWFLGALVSVALSSRIFVTDFIKLGEPIELQGDATLLARVAANIQQFGSLNAGSFIGWPEKFNIWHFPPIFDTGNLILLWLFSVITNSPLLAINVFFLITFPLTFSSMFFVGRRFGFRRTTSLFGALVCAFLPYHIDRGLGHAALANYSVLILAIWVAISYASDHGPALDSSHGRIILLTLGTSFAAFGLYYTGFTILLFLFTAISHPNWAKFKAILLPTLGGMTLAIGVQAALVVLKTSDGQTTVQRAPNESDLYSLKPTALFTPSPWGGLVGELDPLPKLRSTISFWGEGTSSLGILLSFTIVVSVVLRAINRTRPILHERLLFPTLNLTVFFILISTSGSIGSWISSVGLENFRVWSRASVVVSLLAAILSMIIVENVLQHWRWISPLKLGCLAVIALAGLTELLLPQALSEISDSREQSRVVAYLAKQAVEEMESTNEKPTVLQIPPVPFPETPSVWWMYDYDHFIPTLFSTQSSWSYGVSKYKYDIPCAGSATDLVSCARENGFSVIWMDRWGYTDQGKRILTQWSAYANNDKIMDLTVVNERFAFLRVSEE